MKSKVLYTALLLLFMGCKQAVKQPAKIVEPDTLMNVPKAAAVVANPEDSLSSQKWNWADSLIADYIRHSDNDQIKLSLKDTSINEEGLFDRTENRDSLKYFVYNIGHDHNNGEGLVFASDSWVYIDSLNRKLYEYQGVDESLKEWKH